MTEQKHVGMTEQKHVGMTEQKHVGMIGGKGRENNRSFVIPATHSFKIPSLLERFLRWEGD